MRSSDCVRVPNAGHRSTPWLDLSRAPPCKKGKGEEAKLAFLSQALMGNQHRLLVDFVVTSAIGHVQAGHGAGAHR